MFVHRGFKYTRCTAGPARHEISYPDGHCLPGPWNPHQECSERMFVDHVDWVLSHDKILIQDCTSVETG